jgi:hypothetical protein
MYEENSITAEDIAEVIAFAVARARHPEPESPLASVAPAAHGHAGQNRVG